MKKAYKVTFNLLLIGVFSYLVKYFCNAILANLLGRELYGDYSLALRILVFAGSIMLLGTDVSSKRFFVSYLKNKEYGAFKRYIKWNIAVILRTSLITTFIALLLIVAMLIAHDFDLKLIQQKYHLAVFTLSLAPILGYCLLIVSFYLCLEAYYKANFFDSPLKYILILCPFLIFKYLFRVEFNFFIIWFCLFLSLSCLFLIELSILKKIFPRLKKTPALEYEALHHDRKLWFSTSMRIALTNVVFSAICFIDLLLVEIVVKNEHSVGYYAAIMIIANIIWLIPNSCFSFVAPLIRKFDISEQHLEIQRLIRTNNRLKFVATTVTFLIIVFGSKFFLNIFGKDYIVAQVPLIVLSIGYFLGSPSGAAGKILAYTGGEKVLLIVSILELSAMIIAGYIFTYYFGILGMACVTAIIILIATSFYVYYCKKKLNINVLVL